MVTAAILAAILAALSVACFRAARFGRIRVRGRREAELARIVLYVLTVLLALWALANNVVVAIIVLLIGAVWVFGYSRRLAPRPVRRRRRRRTWR